MSREIKRNKEREYFFQHAFVAFKAIVFVRLADIFLAQAMPSFKSAQSTPPHSGLLSEVLWNSN